VVSNPRVLLVDDDDGSRSAMATGIRRVGYEVVEFDGGEPAIRFLEADESADVLITDVRMPGMDGYEVVRRARALRPELAILMATAFGDINGAVQALQGGADDYLTKPVNLLELRKRVELQLERATLTRDKSELQQRLEKFTGFDNIVGSTPAMQQVFERVRVVTWSREPDFGDDYRDLYALEQALGDPSTYRREWELLSIWRLARDPGYAAWAAEHLRDVPKAAFIAGRTAPEGKRMGHAGAIISGGSGTSTAKVAALEAAGFRVAETPAQIAQVLVEQGVRAA
jgi:DNA-binding response OmpR family regulator